MRKILSLLFIFSLLIGNAQQGRYNGWLLGGNGIGTNPFYAGTNDAQDFVLKTNNTERLRLYSTGIFQMATIASSLAAATVGTKSGHYWYDGGTNGLGFAFYKSRYDNGNIMTLTDSVIYSAHKLKRLGGVDDGYWLGTSSNHNTNIVVNSNGSNAPAICTSTSGGVIINPLFGASGYTTNASLKVQASGGLTNIFSVTNASSAILFGVNNSNNTLIANKCIIGSTVNPTANFQVAGDFSVSTTFTNGGALKALTTLSVGSTSTLTGNTRIGGTTSPANALSVTGAIDCSTTFSAGTTSTLAGATRIGGTTAPSATLDVTGTMSVSSTTTLNGLSVIGAMSVTTTFSAGTTATVAGGALSLPSYTASAVANAIVFGSATLDFPSTIATAVADLTLTVVGARDGDVVTVGVPNGAITATADYWGWVSANDVVTIRFSPKATENPASGTFKATVSKN